ncbi:hypothetical protein LZC95_27785 [Pendulispora brunnea]|uniref:Uncharacterized protein n=1 Tax=Pendulispora brunnea TaxID=2905690 RepID=A0ABZ2JV58_9BACT
MSQRLKLALVMVMAAIGMMAALRFLSHSTSAEPLRAASDDASADVVDAGAPLPLVDLLHRTHAAVAVSSQVKGEKERPEHLVDGRPETAWQSRPNDLVGAWIQFRTSPATTVKRIGLTVGYDAISPKHGDLFTLNHRIAKVLVRRDGVILGQWALDVENRGVQYFDVEASGGEYKLEILEVKPGRKKEWREVCVSELVVLGTSDVLVDEHVPVVEVGDLAVNERFPLVADAVPSPADRCNDKSLHDWNGGMAVWNTCPGDEQNVDFTPDAVFQELVAYEGWMNHFEARVNGKWFVLPLEFSHEPFGDTHGGQEARVMEAKVEQSHLWLRVRYAKDDFRKFDEHGNGVYPATAVYSEKTMVCRKSGSDLRCLVEETATASERVGGKLADAKWTTTQTVRMGTSGRVIVANAIDL